MIKIRNLKVRINNQKILENINLDLPDKGLVSIVGESGSGKTTLLNSIAGLLDFSGLISIDGVSISSLSENEKGSLRLNEIGFVYQDFKLFEENSIESNILLPYSSLISSNLKDFTRKIDDTLDIVCLFKNKGMKVSKLSGGEKQRVAIARSIINSPKLLLCDEPTGALDSHNKNEIIKILQKISNNSLVIIVSHDEELVRKFSSRIIALKDGKIISDTSYKINEIKGHILTKKMPNKKRKERLPLRFIFSHIFRKIQAKKIRSSISLFAMSLGLVGFGFSLNLTTSISENIKSTFASVIDDERILISKRDTDNKVESRKSVSYETANNIFQNNPEYFDDIGINYIANYEDFFITTNEVVLDKSVYRYSLNGINIRTVNEFRWLDHNVETIYPFSYKSLKNNEVVLALTIEMINSICYEYRIERSVESLSEYLKLNSIPLTFYLENLNWQFSFDFSLKMVGFTFENKGAIYHSNHLWNQYIFEDVMRFPVSENVTGILDKPWTLRKVMYLQAKDDSKRDEFLSKTLTDFAFAEYLFELGSKMYFPYISLNTSTPYKNKIMIFQNTLNGILPLYSSYIEKTYNSLSRPIYGSYGGYFIYPEIMMMGFINDTYFASDMSLIEKIIDEQSLLIPGENEFANLPDNVVSAHYSESMDDGIIFEPLSIDESDSYDLKSYNNIVISSSLSKELFGSVDVVGKEICVASVINEVINEENIKKEFITTKIKIVGVKNDNKNKIYHLSNWSILFFMTNLDVSRFALDTNIISFKTSENTKKEEVISLFNKKTSPFPFLVASDPMKSINSGVDEVCSYLQIALVCFSSFSILVSILLLSMTNCLFIIENKKDFGLIRCIGLSQKESLKLLLANSGIYGLIAFTLSTIELLFSTLFINFEIGVILGGSNLFNFNPLSLLLMLVLSLFISLISSFVYSRKISKITPLDALKG